jgi:uncharacterized protein YpuA (DUF1002 family)
MKKRILSIFLAALMFVGAAVPASAGSVTVGDQRVVVGANVSDDQKAQIYSDFGLNQGDVTELTVTNAEERQYLEGLVDDSMIGSRSYSCVYILVLEDGAGLEITTKNINWCTEDIYRNALVTAGITDAKVSVSAPFEVSGTAALTGIYKAYEDITGEKLDELAKAVATNELVVTSELADEIGSYDASEIVNELKLILDETVNMTDDEVLEQIQQIADEYNVSLTESQKQQLLKLVRSLEGLDASELKAKVESVQETLKKLSSAQSTISKIGESVKNFFTAIGNWFSKLFGKKN